MTNFINVDLDTMREDIIKALAPVLEKYSCDVKIEKIKYSSASVNMNLDFFARGENGESGEEVQFRELCGNYGFIASDYGKRVKNGNKTLTLIGFNPKARKNYCVLKDETGAQYVAPPELVLRDLGY